MSLEDIEQKTLLYLKQTINPLVRIDVLHEHLSDQLPDDPISLSDFADFLDQHELFRVIHPLAMDSNPGMQDVFDQVGFASAPCVLLATRMPTKEQMFGMMLAQLDTLNNALGMAMREARDRSDTERVHTIRKALDRSVSLRTRIEMVLREDSE